MFKKIITNEKLMNIVDWLLCHSDKEYDAMTIGMSTGLKSPSEFVLHLILLDECGIVNVRKDMEKQILYVSLEKDSELVQHLIELRDLFEEKITSSELAMETIERMKFNKDLSNTDPSDLMGALNNDDKESIINRIKNYKKLNDDDPAEFYLKSRIAKIDEEGNLEEFISFVKQL